MNERDVSEVAYTNGYNDGKAAVFNLLHDCYDYSAEKTSEIHYELLCKTNCVGCPLTDICDREIGGCILCEMSYALLEMTAEARTKENKEEPKNI